VTVLVAALADAAALAERLDPESLHAVLERFTAACSAVLERHGADADVAAGDTVLGVFGLRMRREDDPVRASRAAVEMREATAALVRDVGFRPTVGIGIAAGEVFASAGGRPRGDPMHVAHALATAAGGDEILVDGEAHRLAGAALALEPAEPVAVRGRRAPVHAFRLRGLAAAQTAPPDGPFVARHEPLAALRAAVVRAEDEYGCRRVTVIGPPGIGKSRLARELVGGLGGNAFVTIARCQAYGDGTAAGPLAELVRGLVGGDPEGWLHAHLAGDERADVIAGRVLATLGLSDAAGQPGETAWAVRRVFETAAQERPLVVVLEDAHWADPALLDLVEYILGFSRAPILVLCLARPELLELRPGWAAPQPDSALLALEPLDAAGARTLLAARAPELDEPVIERMIATAEGNPLFLEQLLEVRGEGDDAVLPPSIEAVLAARIDRLAPEEREVLVHASLEGRSFHAGAVAELLPGTERAMIDGALLRLVHKQLIRPDRPDIPGEDAFRFSHALIRDAAYVGMPKRLRGELHERLAGWLLVRPHAPDETVGFHLEQAVTLRAELGPPDQHDRALAGEAAERLAAAARAALLRGDPGAAGRLLERAVALVPGEDPARAELLIELGAALVDAGRLADAERHLVEAVERARQDGDPRLAARARVELELGRQHAGAGQAAAAAVAESALAELARHGDEHGRARAWRLQAWIEWSSSRARAADVAWRRAAAHARNAGDERELFEILGWRASAAAFGPLPVPEAIDRCEAFRAQAGRRPVAVALILHPLGYLHAMAGDFEQARALVAEGSAIFAELGRMEQAVSHAEATVELLAGRPDVAEALLRPGFESLERMGERAYYGTTAAVLAHAVLAQGRAAEAAGLCAASEANAAPEDVGTQAMWRGVRARLLAADGDLGTAERLACEAAALMEPTDLLNDRADVLLDAAEVLRLAGRTDDARGITEQAIALYEQKGNVVSAGRARAREPV
jgi:class 3 adenylate cyclase/tetratricopeptide (TPR) repeat protein